MQKLEAVFLQADRARIYNVKCYASPPTWRSGWKIVMMVMMVSDATNWPSALAVKPDKARTKEYSVNLK